jgi:hypothetical protein
MAGNLLWVSASFDSAAPTNPTGTPTTPLTAHHAPAGETAQLAHCQRQTLFALFLHRNIDRRHRAGNPLLFCLRTTRGSLM